MTDYETTYIEERRFSLLVTYSLISYLELWLFSHLL